MADKKNVDAFLTKLYYSPKTPGSFYGAKKLWQYAKTRDDRPQHMDFDDVATWLDQQNTHRIHSTPKTKFQREAIIVDYPDMQWDIDLLQMTGLSQYNDGYNYILVCIDLFSRYLRVRPLKKKTSTETAEMFQDILKGGHHCETVRSDQGKEFLGAAFTQVLKDNKISHIIAYGEHKANYAERVNRTIEDRLYKYFYENQTFRYIDVLDDIVASYNHTVHNSIGLPPADVNANNTAQIYNDVYLPIVNKRAEHKPTFSFEVGQLVRLSRKPGHFDRGYQEQWTEELFKIHSRIPSHPPRYRVEDLAGEVILGSFYKEELQIFHTDNPDDIVYKIDRVLSTKKGPRGQKLSLVHWYGYSDKFDSYIPTADIQNYAGK